MVTLVIGLPGTGKTSFVKKHLGDGLCYDLDAIASAFRLREAQAERHEGSRELANALLADFISEATMYAEDVFVIRTAPGMDEFHMIAPDRVVYCLTRYVDRNTRGESAAMKRITDLVFYCRETGIPCSCARDLED